MKNQQDKWEELKKEFLKKIEEFENESYLSSVEPEWWLQMKFIQRILNE